MKKFTNHQFLFITSFTILLFGIWFQSSTLVNATVSNSHLENVWVSTDKTITEYDQNGTVISATISVPYNGGSHPVTEFTRDLVIGSSGYIHIYNGTFSPYLTTFSPITSSWTHQTYNGWSTVNNVSYGGIANYQNYIYLTDMSTAGKAAKGIVRFDTTDNSFLRFADSNEYIDLSMGLDHYLYALRSGETSVDVYHPITNSFERTISLANGVRGIAINEEGQLFGASWDDNIYHFASNGAKLNSIASGAMDLVDIDITCDGQLVVGSRFGDVIFSDESLTAVSSFNTGSDQTFVAFNHPRFSCVYIPIIIR